MQWRVFALCLSLAAVGCSTGSGGRPGSTTQPAPAVAAQIPADGSPSLPNLNAFDTTLSPKGAAGVMAGLFKELGIEAIQVANGPISYPFGGADYFSARATEQTALGDLIDVRCRWVRDGQTRVFVRSNLPPVQQVRLVELLRSAMLAAAGRPATTEKGE